MGREREHEAREAAEEHTDTDEGADGPYGTGRPGSPDQEGEDEGDDAVEQRPAPTRRRTELEGEDELEIASNRR